ncbi:hypothetical protein Lal_00030998 [Lupinus albus]|nr:hypothetical protein Lal_00030998 [Lupinus albus]
MRTGITLWCPFPDIKCWRRLNVMALKGGDCGGVGGVGVDWVDGRDLPSLKFSEQWDFINIDIMDKDQSKDLLISNFLRALDLLISNFLRAFDLLISVIEKTVIGRTVIITAVGEYGEHQVHGGGGEGTASNTEEQGHDDGEDVLCAVAEGNEVVSGKSEGVATVVTEFDGVILLCVINEDLAGEGGFYGGDVDGDERSDLGEGSESSGGGRVVTIGDGWDREGVGRDEECTDGPCGGGDGEGEEADENGEVRTEE